MRRSSGLWAEVDKTMDLETLERMTVVKLREEAHKFEEVKEASGMSKEALIDLLCQKHGIERKRGVRKGIGRRALKAKIAALKGESSDVMSSGDRKKVHTHRLRLHHARHTLRKVIAKSVRAEALAAAAKAKKPPPEAPAEPAAEPAPEAPAS